MGCRAINEGCLCGVPTAPNVVIQQLSASPPCFTLAVYHLWRSLRWAPFAWGIYWSRLLFGGSGLSPWWGCSWPLGSLSCQRLQPWLFDVSGAMVVVCLELMLHFLWLMDWALQHQGKPTQGSHDGSMSWWPPLLQPHRISKALTLCQGHLRAGARGITHSQVAFTLLHRTQFGDIFLFSFP